MASTSSNARPSPQAVVGKYEDVVSDPKLFMDTLEKLHTSMRTKFMIPIIGGKELDLHRLFREVTSRGGIEKILRDRRWKEVTAVFNFPSTATNASFVLRKYYYSLLQHYERVYYFNAQHSIPAPTNDAGRSTPEFQPPTSETDLPEAATATATATAARALPPSSPGTPVIGVIDGKFESGYLVTVTIGSEKLKGVLYQAPASRNESNASSGGVHRRKRRKKSEIKRRDPAHPKPNRSGYNFFFAEQHARLKPLHPGKDRDISRMIGELWNKLTETERVVYQEKAIEDKERYRVEMEEYRERMRTGQVISDAVPLRQRFPEQDIGVAGPPPEPAKTADGALDNESSSNDSGDDGSEPRKTIEEVEVEVEEEGEEEEDEEEEKKKKTL